MSTSTKNINPATKTKTNASSNHPLRIALIRQKFRFDGGGERIVSHISDILSSHGHDVSLIARQWEGTSSSVLKCNPPKWTRVQREALFAKQAISISEQENFDLVQSHERIPGCQVYRAGDGVHRSWLEERSRTMPGWRRWLLFRNRYHRYMLAAEKSMYEDSRLKCVICNAQMVADEIENRFAIDPTKLHVIYNGVDTDCFHPSLKKYRPRVCNELQISPDQSIGLFVGSGWERKGLAQAIRGLQASPALSLIILGRDKAQYAFENLASKLGVQKQVHFAGVQSEVASYYGAADFFILPTLYDPFPNSILEAMASGLPVLTTMKCGAAEIITDGESGYLLDSQDESSLGTALKKCSTREHCLTMGKQARKTVEPFTIDAMQQNLTTLYDQLLNGCNG
ncbi:glycosyltransferase family 4 protein [Rubinisphaera italica]|uniref:Lipopolysaccharide core biosynthesis protein RfaG n=1 Tax=Rubinisphaera italica TaxID=2527969 RepID=A0A5C5XBF2_9PLAN|nr:glycosyltransferase family 4 protein [Rubinisphaera italica]TWT59495.1 Lipopolysaccharide core biosynthesis protein RfaG [Rubinisphaera italica]